MTNSVTPNSGEMGLLPVNSKITRGMSGVCPRCMKGNMYKEMTDKYVCLQCGYRGSQMTNEKNVQIFKEDNTAP